MKFFKRLTALFCMLTLLLAVSAELPLQGFALTTTTAPGSKETTLSAMTARAEALVNFEWTPTERIDTWNGNVYNGKTYFEAGETVKGVPYTLFSWELGFDSLLSLEQYESKSASNYSTTRYCNSVAAERTGPAYGNCCATFVSEVFGGNFMNGSNPRYDGVSTLKNSAYSTTYTKVKCKAIQPGDALSCTSGAHIVWVGSVTEENITIYESTPPICRKVVLDKATHTDNNGYLVYNDNVYNIVTKSNALVRNDLASVAPLSSDLPVPLHAYTKTTEKTEVFDSINGTAKANKIYGTDLCFIDAVFENGWCHVNFPLDAGGLEHGYVPTSVFFDDSGVSADQAENSVPVYARSDLSLALGRINLGQDIFLLGETPEARQIAYALSDGGYQLGWISNNDLGNADEPPALNRFCPFKGYPCVTENFEVKNSDYTSRAGEIYPTDYCTIHAIYSDGWCQVTFPLDSGGERTGYTPLSNFILDVSYPMTSYITEEQIDVYTTKELSTYQNWWTGSGDTIYILSAYEDALQICYPIDEKYGGGYKIGWIPRDAVSAEEEPAVQSISIHALPHKTEYLQGEDLDLTGLELLVTYTDNSTQVLTQGYTVSGFRTDTAGEQIITVMYGDKTADFTVCVEKGIPAAPSYCLTNATGVTGAVIEVDVSIEENPGIISLRNQIVYDSEALELVRVTETGVLRGYTTPSSVMESPYTLRWADALALENNTENGVIVRLAFLIKETAAVGDYTIFVKPVESRNFNGEKIEFAAASATVRVVDFMPGDVDADGEVSDWDAILLNRYLAGWEVEINVPAGDIDRDGEVSDWDAILLERYLSGWDIVL